MSSILEALDGKMDEIQNAQAESKGSAKTWGAVAGFVVMIIVEVTKVVFSAVFGAHK